MLTLSLQRACPNIIKVYAVAPPPPPKKKKKKKNYNRTDSHASSTEKISRSLIFILSLHNLIHQFRSFCIDSIDFRSLSKVHLKQKGPNNCPPPQKKKKKKNQNKPTTDNNFSLPAKLRTNWQADVTWPPESRPAVPNLITG